VAENRTPATRVATGPPCGLGFRRSCSRAARRFAEGSGAFYLHTGALGLVPVALVRSDVGVHATVERQLPRHMGVARR
jgi:hypothetical protein